MGEMTKIQWANHTFNPWRGCEKVAPGCANCYAEAQSKRNHGTLGIWGPDGTRVVASEAMWRNLVKWDAAAKAAGERRRVFVASLSDWAEDWGGRVVDSRGIPLLVNADGNWFPEGVPSEIPYADDWGARELTLADVRARLFREIDRCPNLDFLLLTKRPKNAARMIPAYFPGGYIPEAGRMNREGPRENLWLGCSIACQEDADRDIPELLKCRDLARCLFVSAEPLIGRVALRRIVRDEWLVDALDGSWETHGFGRDPDCEVERRDNGSLDLVIVGGESGPNARECDVAWIESIVRDCHFAGVACFVKQLGARPFCGDGGAGVAFDFFGGGGRHWRMDDERTKPTTVYAIRDPKGGDPAEWPEHLRVRELPS